MALDDLKPRDLDSVHVSYTRMVQGFNLYTQEMGLSEIGVWLRLGCGSKTLIGFGNPDSALNEAEKALQEQLDKVRQQIQERKCRNA